MDLVIWLDGPPVAIKGLFDEVAKKWPGKTYYVIAQKIMEERSLINDNEMSKYVEVIDLSNPKHDNEFISAFIIKHRNSLHIFNGYKSATSIFLNLLIKIKPLPKIIIWAERPCPKTELMNNSLFLLIYRIYHILYCLRYRKYISALLAIGSVGVLRYKELGWPDNKLFPFLYVPAVNELLPKPKPKPNHDRLIRFVYVGRFSSKYKGTDVLVKASQLLQNHNYSINMVGGYGDYKEEVIAWINNNPRIYFGGTWPIRETCDRMHDYDVCIVPSRYEGWNATVNQALMAGIGCIVTDEAVSDELVINSGAGIVVKADNPNELANAMDYVMENPHIVDEWHEAAYLYRPKITAATNADYFISILNYLHDKKNNGERPTPPWVVK